MLLSFTSSNMAVENHFISMAPLDLGKNLFRGNAEIARTVRDMFEAFLVQYRKKLI